MAVSAPPKKKPAPAIEPTAKNNEKHIEEIINRGSSTVGTSAQQQVPETIKNINLKLLSSQLATINELRAKRPKKPLSPKLGVSLQDWILEAIEEKMRRERKQYNME